MTYDAQKFIEKYIDLIEQGDIDKILRKCPVHIRPEIIEILESVGITLNDSDDALYGIKTEGTTMTVRAPKDGLFNIGWTRNQGVRGGSQVGFKRLIDARKVADQFGGYPYVMANEMKIRFNWVEVPTIFGTNIFITSREFNEWDPVKRKERKNIHNATVEYKNYL